MSDYLDPANEELLKDFFVEAEMQVEILESNVLVLENDSQNRDAIDEIFRAAHTLKGGAAAVRMTEITEFTHLLEDVLDEIRSGRASITGNVVDTLLNAVDIVKEMIGKRENGSVFEGDVSGITTSLREVLEGTSGDSGDAKGAVAPQAALAEYGLPGLDDTAPEGSEIYEVRVSFREDNPMKSVGGIQVFTTLKQFSQVLKTIPDLEELYEDVYHPVVRYFVAADTDPAAHREKIEISGIVDLVEIGVAGTLPGGAPPVNVVSRRTRSGGRPVEAQEPSPETTALARTATRNPTDQKTPQEEIAKRDAGKEARDVAERARGADKKRGAQTGSVLRVDSRRIDNLLNLVSETVINKASFKQISNSFTENLFSFQQAEARYRESLKELFDSVPDFLEAIQRGESVKDVRKRLNERFDELPDAFDGFHSDLKSTVAKFRNTSQNLGRIGSELQEGVMRIRMVPISQLFSRFPRVVRDLSKSLNKTINLEIEGEETEVDKSVIEDLVDPLTHCVRNSIDHGIEGPSTRREAGKNEAGTVRLSASNEGNMFIIGIEDDGKGIDVERTRRKAIERGVIHPNKQLSDVEAFNLIFEPGFSTAKKITNVSGRGVGLDVVKRQIGKLKGTVKVWSEKGKGSRFTIKIPLTLAIIQGLLVRVGQEIYAIPITSVIDSHRIRPSEIKMIDNYEVFDVRDDVVSLLRLNRLFRIPTNENPEYNFVVIVGTSERKMGLIVDSLIGEEDVVIKPLRDHFTNSPGIAGANITGDGRVSLIVDVSQLLELGLRREMEERTQREMTVRPEQQ